MGCPPGPSAMWLEPGGPVENPRHTHRQYIGGSPVAPAGTLVVEYRELPDEGAWGSLEGLARLGPCPCGCSWAQGLGSSSLVPGLHTHTQASRPAGGHRLVQARGGFLG